MWLRFEITLLGQQLTLSPFGTISCWHVLMVCVWAAGGVSPHLNQGFLFRSRASCLEPMGGQSLVVSVPLLAGPAQLLKACCLLVTLRSSSEEAEKNHVRCFLLM